MSSWYRTAAAAATGAKRPRGRPPKRIVSEDSANPTASQPEPLAANVASSGQQTTQNEQPKRSRGRPRKEPSETTEPVTIRPRGRPRKHPIDETAQLPSQEVRKWDPKRPMKQLWPSTHPRSRSQKPRNGTNSVELNGEAPKKQKYVRKKPLDSWIRDPARRIEFFNTLGQRLGITRMEDWYKIQWSDFVANGGEAMLRTCYNRSIPTALQSVYPTHQWHWWLFSKVPRRFWDSALNQRQFFDWLGSKLNLCNGLHGWYRVSPKQINDNGGASLLLKYNNSMWRALNGIYPIHPWEPWKFEQWSRGTRMQLSDQRLFFDSVARRLGMTSLNDWYQQDAKSLGPEGGYSLIQDLYNGSLALMLEVVYPEHTWNKLLFKHRPHGSYKAFLLPPVKAPDA